MQNSVPFYYANNSLYRRALYSFVLIAAVLAIGTIGLHYIEGFSYINAFYFMSMLATAQGPATAPVTTAGKIFVAFMAFVSVGTVIFATAFLFGPFLGRLIRLGDSRIKKDERVISKDIKKYEKRI